METLIIETNLFIILLAFTLFIVFLALISLLIRRLIKMTTISKNNYYFNNNSLLMRNFQILLINSLTRFLNLFNKLINNYECNQTNDCFERNESKFCGKYLDIRNESKTFAKLITDNYIHFWYNSINGGNYDFINDCENVLQQIFINLFEKCEQKLNSKVVFEKSLILLEKHLINRRFDSMINNSNYLINENERVAQIVERVLRLSAPEEVLRVIGIRNDSNIEITNPSHCFSLFIMIREMLTQSVFIPITDIITDPKFIYSNIILFCEQTNTNNKYNSSIDKQIDKNRSEIENQSSNSNERTFKEPEDIETQQTNNSITSQTNRLHYINKSISSVSLINADSVQQLFRPKSYNNLDLSANHEQKGIKVQKRFI
jgi:hypothetical protein